MSPDSDGDGEIDVKELDSTIRFYKRRKRAGQLGTWHGNLSAQQDPVFPNWLIGRDDFQQVFTRQERRQRRRACRLVPPDCVMSYSNTCTMYVYRSVTPIVDRAGSFVFVVVAAVLLPLEGRPGGRGVQRRAKLTPCVGLSRDHILDLTRKHP